jgi:RNA polymerase sigma factor (sigma-70 family)
MTSITTLPKTDVISDTELALAAAAGDRAALAGIYNRYAARLHAYCVGLLRDSHAASDCVQDVFCIAAAELPKLRNADKLRPWLYAIARRTALRALAERRREPAFDELPDNAATGPGPFTLTAQNELARLIAQAAGGLSERDRYVLELAYRHGVTGTDLAEALGISYDSTKKLLQRLRDTIERSLGALLVARHAAQDGCPQLAADLSGWDQQLTVLMRKRIARHIESCSTCDKYRRSVLNAVALLGGGVLDKVS